MGLNWSIENVRDYEDLWVTVTDADTGTPDRVLNAKTDALIWLSMVVGLYSEITEDTAAEWYARVSLYERLHGAYCWKRGESGKIEKDPITPADIERNIGLKTNGNFKKEAWSTFVNRVTKSFAEDNRRAYQNATSKAKVA